MKFLWSVWGKKVIRSAVQALISYLGAERLMTWGVTLDVAQLTAALYVALEGLRNILKVKAGLKFL